MRSLADIRDHVLALLRTVFLGPDADASDTWDGDEALDEETLGHVMLCVPFM